MARMFPAGDGGGGGGAYIKDGVVCRSLSGLKIWFCYLLGCSGSKGHPPPPRELLRYVLGC